MFDTPHKEVFYLVTVWHDNSLSDSLLTSDPSNLRYIEALGCRAKQEMPEHKCHYVAVYFDKERQQFFDKFDNSYIPDNPCFKQEAWEEIKHNIGWK